MPDQDPLARIAWIPIAGTTQRTIGDFTLDPSIPLPLEVAPGDAAPEIRAEAIVAGALKVLAWDPGNRHAAYLRRFVLAVKPDIKAEFTNVGIAKSRAGEAEIAIEIFRALEGLFPDDAITAMNLALAYEERARARERRGETEGAEEDNARAFDAYKSALAADPTPPALHYNLAYFYLHQRSFEKACEHLAVFVKASDDERRVGEARRIIRQVQEQGLVDGLFQRAFDAVRMGREEEGAALARQFLDSRPGVPQAWFVLGWALRRLGRWAEGRDAFLKALEVGSPHADLLNELAICLMELGDLPASRRRLEEALATEPENTKVISNLGIVALKAGRTAEALGFFRTVAEMDPDDRIAVRYIAEIENKT